MRSVKYIISFLLISFCFSFGFAQALRVWQPDVLEEVSSVTINPSLLESNQGVFIGNQSFFGSFSDVRGFYGFGNVALGKDEKSGIGALARARQEGELIGEYRLKMNYWRKTAINKKLVLIAGIQFGAVNTVLKPTRSTAGGSAWAPDLDIGLTLQLKKHELSLGSSQMTNSTVQPLSQKINFKRYFSASTASELFSRGEYKLSINTFGQIIHGLQDVYRVKALFSWREQLDVGIGVGTDGLRFSLMLPSINVSKQGGVVVGVGFQVPISNSVAPSYQPFQIHLGYKLSE